MKIKKLIALIFLFIVIGVGITVLSYFFFVIDTIRVIPMDIELHSNAYGINGDTDALHFGRIALFTGAYAVKWIQLGNYESHPTIVSVSFSGDMAPWARVEENNFVLEPGESKKLEFRVYPDLNTGPGNYTGKAKIVMKRYMG